MLDIKIQERFPELAKIVTWGEMLCDDWISVKRETDYNEVFPNNEIRKVYLEKCVYPYERFTFMYFFIARKCSLEAAQGWAKSEFPQYQEPENIGYCDLKEGSLQCNMFCPAFGKRDCRQLNTSVAAYKEIYLE